VELKEDCRIYCKPCDEQEFTQAEIRQRDLIEATKQVTRGKPAINLSNLNTYLKKIVERI
jgi:hypothetical protein